MQGDRLALINGGKISKKHWSLLNQVAVYDSATMQEAVSIAEKLSVSGEADAIISPAGTAAEISRHVHNLPIVHCDPTTFDILDSLHYAQQQANVKGGRIGLVLHDSRVIDAGRLQRFLENELVFYSYREEKDIAMIVRQLAAQKVYVMVGGPTSRYFANLEGIDGYILRLGSEAIRTAIEKAQDILSYSRKEHEQSNRLNSALQLFPDGVLILDERGVITECNARAGSFFGRRPEHIVDMRIEKLIGDSGNERWSSVYREGMQRLDRLIELPGISLFSNRIPITMDGRVRGAIIILQDASKIEKLERTYRKYQSRGLVAKYTFRDIIGSSAKMRDTVAQARAFAAVDSPILIEGETGTGKELFAQSIHNASYRKSGPFVAINCAALPENLLESELMGYEEGAFTGARRGGKAGLFELAHTGTIFLDEINQIPVQLQARLLRVLQEKQVLRLGGSKMIPIDVRVIAASNEDLGRMITDGRFREDLYYRLKVLNFVIPPLRERREDIPQMVDFYLKQFSRMYGATEPLGAEALELLRGHSWPGNVRELVNCVERYVVIRRQLEMDDKTFVGQYMESELRSRRLGQPRQTDPDLLSVRLGPLSEMERHLIRLVLSRCAGNRQQAALLLGISRTTLWKKMQEEESKEKTHDVC